MDTLTIKGGTPLFGEISVGGSKNAVLPILAACILTDGETIIHNAPLISDVDDMLFIMKDLGIKSRRSEHTVFVDCTQMSSSEIRDSHVGVIRSSVILLGAVLSRMRKAQLAKTGGCDIGARPIDMHLSAFEKMGVKISFENSCWCCNAQRLDGTEIELPFPSVGATENIILAAAKANGTTVIKNAAKEPEIVALQDFINLMGGSINGAGSDVITVEGKNKYTPCEYTLIPDRIVAGTYLLSVAAAGGDVLVKNTVVNHNRALLDILKKSGAELSCCSNGVRIKSSGYLNAPQFASTEPFPGFPTDLQPQLMAFAVKTKGFTVIRENIYENRFRAAYSLCSLGADITIRITDDNKNTARICGVPELYGTTVYGTDLRCNAALVIAGLSAVGTTVIKHAHYIERGYEDIVSAISNIGGNIS